MVKDKDVKIFICKNLICHFRLTKIIIVDNGSEFISDSFNTFYLKWKIQLRYATPRHSQGNRQDRATNKTLLNIIKKTLDKSKGKWPDILPSIL